MSPLIIKLAARVALVIALLFIIVFLFRGHYDYGMNFDEVYRFNNLIPLFNGTAYPTDQSIYHVTVHGKEVPIMYKQYISSLYVLLYAPFGLFKDYTTGLRTLHLLYFCVSICGFFWICSSYNILLAFVAALLVSTSPVLYPDIRTGFASALHLFLIPLSIHYLYKFLHNGRDTKDLFIASFVLAFAANLYFYCAWIIAALFVSSLILYPKEYAYTFSSIKRGVIILSGFGLGLANYVIYNCATNFSTFKPLYLKLFAQSEYNKNPIDHKQALPLFQEIAQKLKLLSSFLGEYHVVYVVVLTLSLMVLLLCSLPMIKKKDLGSLKPYYMPALTFTLILAFILISPNTTRPGHYVYLLPFYELTLISSLLLCIKTFPHLPSAKLIGSALITVVLATNVYSSNEKVASANYLKGTRYSSHAIYDLNRYLKGTGSDFNNVVHVQWGFYSQLYFLNKGTVPTHTIYKLYDAASSEERDRILSDFFRSDEVIGDKDLYFPIWDFYDDAIGASFFHFIESHGGKLIKEKEFFELNSDKAFTLYKLADSQHFVTSLNTTNEIPRDNHL